MKKLFLVGFLALSFGLPACADLKIALIDTGKAFDAYYKTQEMAAKIAAKKTTFEKDIHELQADYESANQEAQTLADAVKSPSTPLDVRKSKDAALAQKVQDLQLMDREIDQMRRSRSQEIRDELMRGHQQVADEMMKVITAYVSSHGYDLVLDKASGTTVTWTIFPYTSGQVADLTNEIIAKLNASAPSHVQKPAPGN